MENQVFMSNISVESQIMYEWKLARSCMSESRVQTHSKNRMRRNKKNVQTSSFSRNVCSAGYSVQLRELKWTTATSWILLQTYTHLRVNRLMKNFVLFCALMLIRDLNADFFFFSVIDSESHDMVKMASRFIVSSNSLKGKKEKQKLSETE